MAINTLATDCSGTSLTNLIAATLVVAGDDFHYPASIWSVSEGFLRMLTDTQIKTGIRVRVSFEGCLAHGEVAFCQKRARAYNVGIQLIDDNHVRREPRFPIQLQGKLTVLAEHGPQQSPVDLVDVSASGLGMLCKERLSVGACVEVQSEPGVLFGEIRHCEQTASGLFRVGMRMFHLIVREPATIVRRTPKAKRMFGWLSRTQHAKPGSPSGFVSFD